MIFENGQAFDFNIKGGNVSYKVIAKTFGILSDNIVGINDKIKGDFSLIDNKVSGSMIIQSAGFESGNSKRDRDVAKILKYNDYPEIIFQVEDISKEEIDKALEMEKGSIKFKGKLTVANVSKVYDLTINFVRLSENEAKLITEIEAKFTDFGIDPPSFGIIIKKAPDKIFLSGEIVFIKK